MAPLTSWPPVYFLCWMKETQLGVVTRRLAKIQIKIWASIMHNGGGFAC